MNSFSADDFDDRRTVEPIINDTVEAEDASINITSGLSNLGKLENELPEFEIPRLEVYPPKLLPHDHLEIWIEKSTQNDMLGPLCEKHGINFQPGVGEFSITRCLQLVKRAEAHDPRPTRVGVITDFDPAGQSIPVGIARKVQHLLHIMGLDLDIRVEPIALTHLQCEELELPRTPGCARDSIPPLRLEIILDVAINPHTTVGDVRRRTSMPWHTIKRELEGLYMLGILKCDEATDEDHDDRRKWFYSLNPSFDYKTLAAMAARTKPSLKVKSKQKPMTLTENEAIKYVSVVKAAEEKAIDEIEYKRSSPNRVAGASAERRRRAKLSP